MAVDVNPTEHDLARVGGLVRKITRGGRGRGC